MTNTETLQPPVSRRLLRRGGAVLAGVVLVIILDTSLDVIMHATGIYPPWFQPMATRLWFVALGYRTFDSIAGSYLTALLAPDRPRAHALVLGGLGFLLSTAGLIVTWNKGPEFGPRWYPLALVLIALPCAWVGGTIRERQLRRTL
jgi:peptidoglycan/LPS O-acetylase OafA/YrhL